MNTPHTFPLLPQCSHCRRFRTPSGEWVSNIVLAVLSEHPSFPYRLTHGICPECIEERDLMEACLAIDLGDASNVVGKVNATQN